jgi:hypothetical protein
MSKWDRGRGVREREKKIKGKDQTRHEINPARNCILERESK